MYSKPIGVDESTLVDESGLHALRTSSPTAGKFVEQYFPSYLIVRLPGLVGPGLRKNVILTFFNNNNLHAIESRGRFPVLSH